jgi:membrane protease YdiL (CAAX protease family)
VLLLVSGQVRSYREGQIYLLPVFLGGLVPALAPLLPGLPLRSVALLVPVANVSLGVRDVMAGRLDWLGIAVAACVTALAAAFVTRISTRALSDEEALLGRAPLPADGNALRAFEGRVTAWFAGMWALVFVASGAVTGMRAQILFNQLVVFLGLSLLIARRYRLPVRQLLGLRPVRGPVLVAAVLAAPASVLIASAVFRLSSAWLPVSRSMLQELSDALSPRGMWAGERVFLFALLPAVCEELAFRGVLVQGLKRRLPPLALCLVGGCLFGLFHFAYFRLVPTAVLGMLLTAIALLTRSTVPGMIVHAGNNTLALLAADRELPLDGLPPSVYVAALLALGASFWVFYRCRTGAEDDSS